MTSFDIRIGEECRSEPFNLWDTHLVNPDDLSAEGGYGEWSIDPATGGLSASNALASAVVIALFTDRRAPADVATPDGSPDRRGWPGDAFDIDEGAGEGELGSLLWTLARSPLTWETERMAEQYALAALQPLVDQGMAARVEVAAASDHETNPTRGMLTLAIDIFARSGERVYAQKFQRLWAQTIKTGP